MHDCRTRLLIITCLIIVCSHSGYCFNLECKYLNVKLAYTEGKSCEAQNVKITNETDTITSVNGNATPDASLKDVKILSIRQQLANYLPKGVDKFFPHLEAIEIINSKLKKIDRCDFEPFKYLKDVHMGHNDIKSLDNDLFLSNTQIECVQFHDNNIEKIGTKTFDVLKDLKTAYFKDNVCIKSENVVDGNDQEGLAKLLKEIKTSCAYDGSSQCVEKREAAKKKASPTTVPPPTTIAPVTTIPPPKTDCQKEVAKPCSSCIDPNELMNAKMDFFGIKSQLLMMEAKLSAMALRTCKAASGKQAIEVRVNVNQESEL